MACAKYPPEGRRGAGFGMAHDDYRPGSIVEKMTQANRELLLIAQIETARVASPPRLTYMKTQISTVHAA